MTDLVLGTRSLKERLVCTATTGDDTDHTTAGAGKNLLGTGGELDAGLALIGVVANDGNVVTGGTAERTTVTVLVLDVGQDGSLGDGVKGQDVANGESGVLSGVDELCNRQTLLTSRVFEISNLASVHALVGNEGLGVVLKPVGVAEGNAGQRSACKFVRKTSSLTARGCTHHDRCRGQSP